MFMFCNRYRLFDLKRLFATAMSAMTIYTGFCVLHKRFDMYITRHVQSKGAIIYFINHLFFRTKIMIKVQNYYIIIILQN